MDIKSNALATNETSNHLYCTDANGIHVHFRHTTSKNFAITYFLTRLAAERKV